MFTVRTWFVMTVCALFITSHARAENWLTGWIPGGKKETSSTKTSRTPLLGGRSVRSTSKTAAKPSMWQRMSNGTRKLAANTKDALTFGEDEKPKGRHSSWDDAKPARSSRKKDEPSVWSRWFGGEESRPSKTVDDFLSQKRPEQVP